MTEAIEFGSKVLKRRGSQGPDAHRAKPFFRLDAEELMCIILIMKGTDIIRKLKRDGWKLKNVRGSHHQFVHTEKLGRVTVKHPSKDIPVGTLRNIYRQAGRKWRDR